MFTSKMFKTPVSVSSPDAGSFFSSIFGGGKTRAGVTVTPESALAITTCQACVSMLAESIAQLPCELYKRDGDSRKKARDHHAYTLIHDAPNERQTPFEFFEGRQVSLGLLGNSYVFVERDQKGRAKELIPLDTRKVTVYKGSDGMPYYRLGDGAETLVPMRHINHVKWINLNGYTGLSPVLLHANTLGLAIATQEHASSVFSEGTNLAGVLERPAMIGTQQLPPLSPERVEEVKKKWNAEYSGQGGKRVAILQDGITFRAVSMTNEDAQLIDSRKLSALEIAQIYHMPPHKVGLLDNATFSNIEHQGIEYVAYTLMPWVKRFEQSFNRDLLLKTERGEYYFEFNVSGLLRGDTKSRHESYALALQNGWMSINDIRRMENLPPVEGADQHYRPLNMAPTNEIKEQVQSALKG